MTAADLNRDPFDLERFVTAQEEVYRQALTELRRGRKESHWIWFIFPQLDGLGSSETTKHYSIKSRQEAADYLKHPVLGTRLVQCVNALLRIHDKSALEIMGYPDDLKLHSCMTLFAAVAGNGSIFHQVLDRCFQGQPDRRTIDLLASE